MGGVKKLLVENQEARRKQRNLKSEIDYLQTENEVLTANNKFLKEALSRLVNRVAESVTVDPGLNVSNALTRAIEDMEEAEKARRIESAGRVAK